MTNVEYTGICIGKLIIFIYFVHFQGNFYVMHQIFFILLSLSFSLPPSLG